MAIIQLPLPIAANTGVTPNIKNMKVTDDLAAVTTAAYLNAVNLQGYTVSPGDEIHVRYNASFSDENQGDLAVMKVSVSNGVITLVEDISEGNVVLPVTVGDFAVFQSTSGKIYDAGYLPSDATEEVVAMVNETNTLLSNHIAVLADGFGTIKIQANAEAINLGQITSGDNDAVAGKFVAKSGAAGSGSLILEPTVNTGSSTFTIKPEATGASVVVHVRPPTDVSGDGYAQVSNVPSDVCANLFVTSVTVAFSDLSGAGSKILNLASSVSAQYRILDIFQSIVGTIYGGGDRDMEFTDGTTAYTTISAADLGGIENRRWGGTKIPFSTIFGCFTPTAAGANLIARYTGGTTDYTSGSITFLLVLQKTA